MPKTSFLDKFLERIDRIDRKHIASLFMQMAQEHGLLETIFNSLQEGVIVSDKNLNINFVNNKTKEMLRPSEETTNIGKLTTFFSNCGIEELAKDIENNQSQWLNKEIEILRPVYKILRINTMPLYNNKGAFIAYIVLISDVTQDREKEREHIKAEKLAVMSIIAAGIAHEIGNPLNSVDIHLQLLERSLNNDKPISKDDLLGTVSIIKSEIRRLDRIISNFLTAVRPVTPEYKLTEINIIIREILRFMEPELKSLNITTIVNLDKKLPKILLDANQIKQAFSNLIKNAVQAMPHGGKLTISAHQEKHFIRITFKDTGRGIPRDLITRIFEPYTTSKVQGSGLGLMITDRIIHEHGGTIGVNSIPGKGTLFTIDLPIIAEKEVRMLPEKTEDKE